MSTLVTDLFDDITDFDDLLDAAEANASTGWEMDFISDMRERHEQYGERMYLSEKQRTTLERIANEQ